MMHAWSYLGFRKKTKSELKKSMYVPEVEDLLAKQKVAHTTRLTHGIRPQLLEVSRNISQGRVNHPEAEASVSVDRPHTSSQTSAQEFVHKYTTNEDSSTPGST